MALQEIVFSFDDLTVQPSENDLYDAVIRIMECEKPELLRKIELLQKLEGVFVVRLQPIAEDAERLKWSFDISRCLSELKGIANDADAPDRKKKWLVSRYDFVPSSLWVKVTNVPISVADEVIAGELSRYGDVGRLLLEGWSRRRRRLADGQIHNGNRFVEIYMTKCIPCKIMIGGALAVIKYIEKPNQTPDSVSTK